MANDIFIKKLQPKLEPGLSKPQNVRQLHQSIGRYVDMNVDKLTTSGPLKRPVFTESDKAVMFDAAEIDSREVKEFIKSQPSIKSGWELMNDPFNLVSALAIRYYTIKKDVKTVILLRNYLMLSMYPSLHYKYFKYNTTPAVMEYTINNLSNKFKIKQAGTIYNALSETVEGSYTHHKDRLVRGQDKDIVDFVMDVKTRINSLMKNVAREYYKNHESKNYMNADSDNFNPDDYHETDSNMYAIDRIATKVTMRLVTNGANANMVNMAARWCKVSMNELRNYTNQLINGQQRENIQAMNESILYLYLYDEKNKVEDIRNNTKFLAYCLEMYKKSNTTDKNIIKIKSILDEWLQEVGTYKKTQRVATINDFRRALFIFFVISIMNYA